MEINELRDKMVKVVKIEHPKERSLENRFIDLTRQVGGFGESLQFRQGNLPKCSQHDTLQHQIASIMVDLFLISDMIGADVEEELLDAIKFFETGSK